MNQPTRRAVLRGAGSMAAATAAAVVAGPASPAVASIPRVPAVPLPNPPQDVTHATPLLVKRVNDLFRDKTARDVDRFMSHFSADALYYTDATLGWYIPSWAALHAIFAQYMPTWPHTARSYATRIIGDEHSAIVEFTDSPELFGHEIRAIAAVDFRDGRIVREVDYWDGRHFGTAAVNSLRTPDAQFPTAYGEQYVPVHSSPALRRTLDRLHTALAVGDTTGLFAEDALFEDLALHIEFAGASAIDAYVHRAYTRLPYGVGTTVRRTLGSGRGGGYEWVGNGIIGSHGIIAVELDPANRISRLTTTWDASRIDDAAIATLLADTLEH
ncbi:nuclear transport factor 2 family protein [Kribbella sp. NPDC055071]